MKKILSSILLLGLSLPLLSAEVDHFTNRHLPLVDSSSLVDRLANEHLQQALEIVNKQGQCSYTKKDTFKLYEELKVHFANHRSGKFVKELLSMRQDISHSLMVQDSVYKDWKFYNGFVLSISLLSKKPLGLFPLLNYDGYSLGLDKFEHMFGMGFIYFNRHNLKNQSVQSVLKHGRFREKTVLGGFALATGVFSYADLAANFNGMRFWNHMLQQEDDVLGKEYNRGPYIECIEGKWEPQNEISFSYYIDESMDESLNCSTFANKSGQKKFTSALKSIDPEYSCPMSKTKINKMKDKYRIFIDKETSISDLIINPKQI